MSGCIEIGTCSVCKEETIGINRKYFNYDIKCECHSPNHFELVYHCNNCIPIEPVITKMTVNTENLMTLE